jgi:hypothetical protein
VGSCHKGILSNLLRRTFRAGPQVKHETLGHISHLLPPDLVERIRHAGQEDLAAYLKQLPKNAWPAERGRSDRLTLMAGWCVIEDVVAATCGLVGGRQ